MLNKLFEWVLGIVAFIILYLGYLFLKFLYSLISKEMLFIFSVLVVVAIFHYLSVYRKNRENKDEWEDREEYIDEELYITPKGEKMLLEVKKEMLKNN